ncbi:MAG: DUF2213 domain-containing protein [Firmicutes bacterium]|nr:DUF2213 domain-containing protein [Bacillota bacterium]
MQQRTDSIPLDTTYFTEEGYLIDKPIVTKIGVFDYKNEDGSPRRELRLPTHVFDPKSLATYEGKPIIMTHDAGWITEDNLNREIVGTVLTTGTVDGDKVRAKIIIHEIEKVKNSGLRELSLGYKMNLIEEPGEYLGEKYDAIQTDIQINHLALVGEARAGETARLNLDQKDSPPDGRAGNNETQNIPQNGKGALKMQKKKTNKISTFTRFVRDGFVGGKKKRRKDSEETPLLDPPAGRAGENIDNEEETFDNEEENIDNDIEETATDNDFSETPTDWLDNLKEIMDRKDRRDSEELPTTLESALEEMKAMDEDMTELFNIINESHADNSFSPNETTNEDDDEDFLSSDTEEESADEEENEDEGETETEYIIVEVPAEQLDRKDGNRRKDGKNPKMKLKISAKSLKQMGFQSRADSKAQIEREVRERSKVISIAQRLNLDGLENMTVNQVKNKIIRKVTPSVKLDGKSDVYRDAAFNVAVDMLETQQKREKSTTKQKRSIYGNPISNQRNDDLGATGKSSAATARQKMQNNYLGGKK